MANNKEKYKDNLLKLKEKLKSLSEDNIMRITITEQLKKTEQSITAKNPIALDMIYGIVNIQIESMIKSLDSLKDFETRTR